MLFISYRKHTRRKKRKARKEENKQKVVSPSKRQAVMKRVGHLVAGVETVTFS